MFSHDENSSGYSDCDTKYGDVKDVNIQGYWDVPWSSNLQSATSASIENKIKPKSMFSWFSGGSSGTSISSFSGLNNINTSQCTSLNLTFAGYRGNSLAGVSSWDTSNVTDMGMTFYMTQLTSLDLSNWNTSKVTNMLDMFMYSSSLTNLNISSFDTRQGTSLDSMFSYCTNLNNIVYGPNFVFVEMEGRDYYNQHKGSMFDNCPANKPSWW